MRGIEIGVISHLSLPSSRYKWNLMYCIVTNLRSKPNHVPLRAPLNKLLILCAFQNSDLGFGHNPNKIYSGKAKEQNWQLQGSID